MNKSRLIMVGGFLGAGKTTLLFETTKRLMQSGKRIGLITNDQAPELVDTALLLNTNVKVAEVSGSCFCCNFNGLLSSLKQVKAEAQADIIIAEPVGSCTDLSATIIQPLRELMETELVVSPLTVLADPHRLNDILDGGTAGLHTSTAYIFRKQLEESDIILISKTDLLSSSEIDKLNDKVKFHFPEPKILSVSSKTGDGIDVWLKIVMENTFSGQRIVEVDYDTYAEGEAVLGWFNSTLELRGQNINWDKFTRDFLTELSEKFDSLGAGVGHVKVMLENGANYTVGNFTGKLNTLSIREKAGFSNEARIIINARVDISPGTLEESVQNALNAIAGNDISIETITRQCLSPGFPKPTYRYTKVV